MNHIHRLVWNSATSTWVAVAENARGRGKGSSRKLVAAALSLTLAAGLAQAAPAGGVVANGAGVISQSGAVTTIQQATPNLSLNWNSFNIGKTETVNFVQPSASAVAVNRILDTNASQILGRLNANGQVYLINPNGILFGQGSVVNVGGLFASSTGASANITNKGSLIANGGGIKLEAANVINTGLIQAQTVGNQQGSIILLGNMRTGTTTVGGTLDASAPNGGNGGFIETSAAHVKIVPGFHITTAANTGQTGTWLIDPVDFTIAASGGDMTGPGVSQALLFSDFQIKSSQGGSGTLGDINVNDVVNWSKNTLTLMADNNININANLNGSGTAKLALEYGLSAPLVGNLSNYLLKKLETWPNGSTTVPNTFKAVVNLPAGQNFSTRQGSDGLTKDYTVVTALGASTDATTLPTTTTLQSLALASNMAGNFVLGGNIEALETKDWNVIAGEPRGFTPIGDTTLRFKGIFDGLGHTISDIYINMGVLPDVGLFGFMVTNPLIQNVGLLRGSVSGGAQTGGLVGNKQGGLVTNSFNTGTVNGGAGTGGLVGQNTLGDITHSYSTGAVNGAAYTGGLVGSNGVGNVSYSYSTGDVAGLVPISAELVRIAGAGVGGLVGTLTTGGVDHSYATGNVSGAAGTGGLVGTITTGVIRWTFATGNVTGGAGTGGLVGTSTGLVELSFATGNAKGTVEGVAGAAGGAGVGGLIGKTTGSVLTSYATGNASGDAGVGGLVGNATDKLISNVYATGNVTGNTIVGGLLGSSTGPLTNSYATGMVTELIKVSGTPTSSGGLVGAPTGVGVSSNFYNVSQNPVLLGGGAAGALTSGITGLSTSDMTLADAFLAAGWIPAGLDTKGAWSFKQEKYPELAALSGIGIGVVKPATVPATTLPTQTPPPAPKVPPVLPIPQTPALPAAPLPELPAPVKPAAIPEPAVSTTPAATPAPTVSTTPAASPAPTVSTTPAATPAPTVSTTPAATPAPTVSTTPAAIPAPVAIPATAISTVPTAVTAPESSAAPTPGSGATTSTEKKPDDAVNPRSFVLSASSPCFDASTAPKKRNPEGEKTSNAANLPAGTTASCGDSTDKVGGSHGPQIKIQNGGMRLALFTLFKS